ncbi:hypothetical protein ACIRVF_39195 [Kitasatospora sp. NPDC101157]|uniref:hypothetical protein n=1 Tax=Kitasatospora sp. NPDC101157 TaxID=3364098 RepID=UPI003802478F
MARVRRDSVWGAAPDTIWGCRADSTWDLADDTNWGGFATDSLWYANSGWDADCGTCTKA